MNLRLYKGHCFEARHLVTLIGLLECFDCKQRSKLKLQSNLNYKAHINKIIFGETKQNLLVMVKSSENYVFIKADTLWR